MMSSIQIESISHKRRGSHWLAVGFCSHFGSSFTSRECSLNMLPIRERDREREREREGGREREREREGERERLPWKQ